MGPFGDFDLGSIEGSFEPPKTSKIGNLLGSLGKGFKNVAGVAGGPLGSIGAALVGGAISYFNNKGIEKRKNEAIRQRSIQKEFYRKENAKAHMRSVLNSFPVHGLNSDSFHDMGLSGL